MMLLLFSLACASQAPPDLAEQDPNAALYSAKGSSSPGANWSGEWTPRLWATDPQHPNVVALRKRLGDSRQTASRPHSSRARNR